MLTQDKPAVHFIGEPNFWIFNDDAEVASLPVVINHPVLGFCINVRTSRILQKFSNGSFETRNTMYIPATKEMQDEIVGDIEEKFQQFLQDYLAGNKA